MNQIKWIFVVLKKERDFIFEDMINVKEATSSSFESLEDAVCCLYDQNGIFAMPISCNIHCLCCC